MKRLVESSLATPRRILPVTVCATLVAMVAATGCGLLLGDKPLTLTGADSGAEASDATTSSDTGAARALDAGVETGPTDAGVDAPVDAPLDAGADAPASPDDAPSCANACALGATVCNGQSVAQCTLDSASSCTVWTATACSGNDLCSSNGTTAFCCDQCCDPGSPCAATSCAGSDAGDGIVNCGPDHAESCCSSERVVGGTFFRSFDAVKNTSQSFPATVSAFALDRFEVTVGRFRRFVAAWDGGWRPSAGAGKHSHLNDGSGLVDSSADAGTYETGWDVSWSANLPTNVTDWTSALECDPVNQSWTQTVGTAETAPINCVTWYQAQAFCIWDGGFLPSEAEWNYAAAGGGGPDGQRALAWSQPPPSVLVDCTYASYEDCVPEGPTFVGKESPRGDGKWAQADLTGNEWEWNLDFIGDYVNPCADCAYLSDDGQGRSIRGASFNYPGDQLYVATRDGDDPSIRYSDDGVRCARAP